MWKEFGSFGKFHFKFAFDIDPNKCLKQIKSTRSFYPCALISNILYHWFLSRGTNLVLANINPGPQLCPWQLLASYPVPTWSPIEKESRIWPSNKTGSESIFFYLMKFIFYIFSYKFNIVLSLWSINKVRKVQFWSNFKPWCSNRIRPNIRNLIRIRPNCRSVPTSF